MARFNKQNVVDALYRQIEILEKQWGFDPNNGYSQIKNADLLKIMAYGEYEGYKNVVDMINYKDL